MKTQLRWALSLGAVLGLGLAASGCGPLLTAGIIAGADSAGSSSSSAPNNASTTVTGAAAVGDTGGGTVTVEFSVQDAEGDPVNVELRFSSDPNDATNALFTALASGQFTDAAGTPTSLPLATSSGGTTYRFLWNTAQDLGTTLNEGSVRIQLVIDGELAFTTAFFSVDNTSSPMISLVNLPALPSGATTFADAQNANAIPLQVTLMDADAQPARVDVLFSTDGGVTFPTSNVAAGTFTDGNGTAVDPTALPTTPSGTSYTFAWNSALNGISVSNSIVLRFEIADSKSGAPRDSAAFAVNNAAFSALIATPGPGASVDRIEVEYVLIDDAAGALDVLVEYSVSGPGGPFRPCTQALQPPTEGTFGLAAPVSPGREHTFLWNSFNDFRAVGQFTTNSAVLRVTPYRRATQVLGTPVLSGSFSVDQRLIRSVFGEGVDFTADTVATGVDLPPLADVAASPQFLELASGPFGFLGEAQLPGGALSLVNPGGFNDVHRVGLDAADNRFVLDRDFSFGVESQDITLTRVDRATGIGTPIFQAVAVPFAASPEPGENAALAVAGNRVMVSLQTSGLGHVLRSVPTLGGPVVNHSFGGTVPPAATPVPINAQARVSALRGNPGVAGNVLASLQGPNPGVFRTLDSGASWTQLLPIAAEISDLDADFAGRIVAAQPGGGVQVSLNNGTSWTLQTGGLPPTPQLSAVEIESATTFYTALTGAVFQSVDSGGTWAAFGTGFPATAEVRDLLRVGGTLFAATSEGVWSTTGGPWGELAGIPSRDVRALTVDATFLVAATAAGVAVLDGTWQTLNSGLTSVDTLAIVSLGAGQVLVSTRDAGVFESLDNGNSWQFAAGGLSDPEVTALAFDTSRIFVGTGNAGVFSLDPGATEFQARPAGLLTSALLRIAHLAPGPVPDTYVYGDTPGNRVIALNLSGADVTICNVLVPMGSAVRIAGTGSAGSSSSGVPAATSNLGEPVGVASDPATGAVFFSSTRFNRVWRIDAGGTATVFAGVVSFFGGFSGDGGPANQAELNTPTALSWSSDGALYVVDAGNSRVRRIFGGLITNAAGTDPPVGDGQLAGAGVLAEPAGVLLTPSGLLIADTEHHRVRRVDPATGVITTVAGNGVSGIAGDGGPATQAEVGGPQGLALAPDGSVLIAQRNGAVRRLRTDGVIETAVAGRSSLAGIALRNDILLMAENGIVFAANLGAAAAVVGGVNVPAGAVGRIAGGTNGGAGETPAQGFEFPDSDLADVAWLSNGDLLFVDQGQPPSSGNGRGAVWLVGAATGSITRVAGASFGGSTAEEVTPPSAAELLLPSGLLVITDTLFVVVESQRQVLRAVNLDAAPATVVGITIPPNSIKVIAGTLDASGAIGDGGPALFGRLALTDSDAFGDLRAPPVPGLALDPSGNLFFADPLNNRIRVVNSTGILLPVAGGGLLDGDGKGAGVATLSQALAITTHSDGSYAVFDGGRVRLVDPASTRVSTVAGTGAQSVVDPATLPPSRVSSLQTTGFGFVRDLIFPSSDLFGGTLDSGNRILIEENDDGFDGAYTGMVVEELDANGFVQRTSVITDPRQDQDPPESVFVSFNEDQTSWNGKDVRVNDAFDLSGPRAISAATVNGATLVAIADTRNHAVFLANTGSVAFVCSGYPSEPGGAGLTLAPGMIARVAGNGGYEDGADPFGNPVLPPLETVAEQVTLGFPMGVKLLPSGLLVIADTLYAGNGRIVALNLGAAPVNLGGVSGIVPGGAATVVPVGTARRPFSVDVRGEDLAWSEHGLPNSSAIPWRPRVQYQAHVAGTAFGVATVSGSPVTVLGDAAPYVNGVALNAVRGVAFDAAGNLFVVDAGEQVVFGLDPAGNAFVLAGDAGQLTILGDGLSGSDGDGGPGSSALLRGPYGVAVDPATDAVLILDALNFSVRRVRRFP